MQIANAIGFVLGLAGVVCLKATLKIGFKFLRGVFFMAGKKGSGFNWRALIYGTMVAAGAVIAITPFWMGGFTLAGAAKVIADFVALPVANTLFGWLVAQTGPWWSLGIVASIPLVFTAIVDIVQATVSAIVGVKTTYSDSRSDDFSHSDRAADRGRDVRRENRRDHGAAHRGHTHDRGGMIDDVDLESEDSHGYAAGAR